MREDRTVRLACQERDNDEFDGITEEELAALIAKGEWQDIEENQTYAESISTFEPDRKPPPGWSVLVWFTHIGLCPDCRMHEEP
jgi:hypothetical protein